MKGRKQKTYEVIAGLHLDRDEHPIMAPLSRYLKPLKVNETAKIGRSQLRFHRKAKRYQPALQGEPDEAFQGVTKALRPPDSSRRPTDLEEPR